MSDIIDSQLQDYAFEIDAFVLGMVIGKLIVQYEVDFIGL